MKKGKVWYVIGVLLLGLMLLVVSCGGGTTTKEEAPTTTPAKEQPAVEQPAKEQPAVTEQPAKEQPAVTPAGGPSAIPHTLEGRADCLMCHAAGGLKPFPADHAGRTNATCTGCHQPKP